MAIQIDMNPDGSFRAPPRPFGQPGMQPVSGKLLRMAILITVLATAGAVAFIALWVALALIPLAIGAGLVAYGLIRYRMWKNRGSFRSQSPTFRR